MPHYKCAACRARLHVSGRPAELVGDLCPECGSLLEPVSELTELVGFRSITTSGSGATAAPSTPRERIAERVDEFVARRTAMLDRDRLNDPATWLDGDDPQAVAVALPPPRTYV